MMITSEKQKHKCIPHQPRISASPLREARLGLEDKSVKQTLVSYSRHHRKILLAVNGFVFIFNPLINKSGKIQFTYHQITRSINGYLFHYYNYYNNPLRVVHFHITNWAFQLRRIKNPEHYSIPYSHIHQQNFISDETYAGFKIWWHLGCRCGKYQEGFLHHSKGE